MSPGVIGISVRDRERHVLFVSTVLVEKMGFDRFRPGFTGTPRDHVFHFAGDAAFAQFFLENTMDIRLLVLVLDLVTAFLSADLTCTQHRGLACLPAIDRVFAGKALV